MTIDTHALTRAYVNMRDARAELKKTFDAHDKDLKAKQERLEAEMLRILQETHADSISTPAGVFYRQEEITPTGADWDAFYRWVSEHQAFDALERRIKKTFIREYLEANEGSLPPGVSVFREYVVRVRRS